MNTSICRIAGGALALAVSKSAKRNTHTRNMTNLIAPILLALLVHAVSAREFHVSVKGNDNNDGSSSTDRKSVV